MVGGFAAVVTIRTMTVVEDAPAPKAERWTAQWKELFEEVIDGGLCTGCSGCVIACPHDVIGYDDKNGVYKPFHLEDELGPGDCTHGQKGCTSCRAASFLGIKLISTNGRTPLSSSPS